jgi:hypothetical protein
MLHKKSYTVLLCATHDLAGILYLLLQGDTLFILDFIITVTSPYSLFYKCLLIFNVILLGGVCSSQLRPKACPARGPKCTIDVHVAWQILSGSCTWHIRDTVHVASGTVAQNENFFTCPYMAKESTLVSSIT